MSVDRRNTNTTTYFLREAKALELIRDEVVLPNSAAKRRTVVWSVGCSSGDEPYSLAMLCREIGETIDILATDINPDAVERARRARYPERNLRHVDERRRARWFTRRKETWELAQELRDLVDVREHDVTRDAVPRTDVDVVLCRNVMVYFTMEQGRRAVDTIVAAMRPGALCIFSAAELLRFDPCQRGGVVLMPIERSGVIVYQRREATVPAPITRAPAPPPPPLPDPVVRQVEELRQRGDAALDAGRPCDARACYRQAAELAPLFWDLYLRIGLCHLHLQEAEPARDALRRSLFLRPRSWQAWLLLADLAHGPQHELHCLEQAREILEASGGDAASDLEPAFARDRSTVLAAIQYRQRRLR